VLAVLGDVPARSVLRKLLIAAPFAVMVGLFNPLIDTAPEATIGTVTIAAGWLSFASIIVRFGLTVSAAIAMVAGTGLHGLCSALGRIGVPPVFTAQLLFMMRYVFVLGGEASRMVTARELRSAGRRARLSEYGPLVGHMLLRAFERAQRIHLAMLARGFDGHVRGLKPLRWGITDTWFTLGWCAFFLAVRVADFPHWIGRALLGVVS
jgi:cobalt/nickel transport system permease protein